MGGGGEVRGAQRGKKGGARWGRRARGEPRYHLEGGQVVAVSPPLRQHTHVPFTVNSRHASQAPVWRGGEGGRDEGNRRRGCDAREEEEKRENRG